MPQRWGKPGSVTATSHTGQLVKPYSQDTRGALGGGESPRVVKGFSN